MTYRNVTGTSE